MQSSYYNTTKQGGVTLAKFQAKAATQDEKVLELFRAYPKHEFTAEDVGRYVLPRSPRTSWGRALTNLKERGLIVKTDNQREGEWGRPIYTWRLTTLRERQQQGEFDL